MNNDFGFTLIEEKDLEQNSGLSKDLDDMHDMLDDYQKRLSKMHHMISILLDNLSLNPEKPIIKWPNRVEKIKEFRIKLNKIKNGE